MGEIIDLFSGEPIPAARTSEFVQEFTDGPLGDFLFALNGLHEAATEAEFREYLRELKELANGWPV